MKTFIFQASDWNSGRADPTSQGRLYKHGKIVFGNFYLIGDHSHSSTDVLQYVVDGVIPEDFRPLTETVVNSANMGNNNNFGVRFTLEGGIKVRTASANQSVGGAFTVAWSTN